jgi:sugar phosphate isomerase/epimerase
MKLAVFPKGFMEQLSDGSMKLSEWIDIAADLKVDGIEMYPRFLQATDQTTLQSIKDHADARQLAIPMMCSSPDFTHPDPSYRAEEVRKMKRMIDVMTFLGPPAFRSCRVLSGQNRPGLALEDGIRWTVDCIYQLLPYAAARNVQLVMENHYKDGFWTYPEFAQASVRFLAIIDRIDSPWFGVNYDPSNTLLAGEDPLELLAKVKHRVLTMHASDRYLKEGHSPEELRNYTMEGYSAALAHGVIGRGLNDYDAIFRELRSVRFDGWISIEDGVNGIEDLKESVHFLRGKMNGLR